MVVSPNIHFKMVVSGTRYIITKKNIYLDPPKVSNFSPISGLFLVVFWGSNFRHTWRIQVCLCFMSTSMKNTLFSSWLLGLQSLLEVHITGPSQTPSKKSAVEKVIIKIGKIGQQIDPIKLHPWKRYCTHSFKVASDESSSQPFCFFKHF